MEMTLNELEKERDLADRQVKRAESCLDSAVKRRNNAIKMIEELKKVDYSQFIGFDGEQFAILGENGLIFNSVFEDIIYGSGEYDGFNKPYSYIDVPCSELKKGDTVCFYPDKKEKNLCVFDFGIFKGINKKNHAIFQIISNVLDIEIIKDTMFYSNSIVRKFIKEK